MRVVLHAQKKSKAPQEYFFSCQCNVSHQIIRSRCHALERKHSRKGKYVIPRNPASPPRPSFSAVLLLRAVPLGREPGVEAVKRLRCALVVYPLPSWQAVPEQGIESCGGNNRHTLIFVKDPLIFGTLIFTTPEYNMSRQHIAITLPPASILSHSLVFWGVSYFQDYLQHT